MMLMPAAMFSMFFYLSLYIQNVMGYSPLQAGFAFLPFSAGIVVAAGLASNLINRVDPRYLSGMGTLMAAIALFGFSRLPYNDVPRQRRDRWLRNRRLAVHRLDVSGHGLRVRAAHPVGGAPRQGGGLRHRVRRTQHDAAGRRCARSRDPGHRGDPRVERHRRAADSGCREGRRSRSSWSDAIGRAGPGDAGDRREPRSSPTVRPPPSCSAPA